MVASTRSEQRVRTEDGYDLVATAFEPSGPSRPGRIAVINAGAGIPARYYHSFATHLAERGIPVVTYDYRGIGKSRFGSLNGFSASVEDWGSKDCAAILRYAKLAFPKAKIAVIGHSIGSFLTGFVTDPAEIDLFAFIGGHTGYFGDYRLRSRVQMALMWHVVMPAISRKYGFFPGRRFGLPDDLPLGVALEWAGRRRPDFRSNINQPDGSPDMARRGQLTERFSAFSGHGLLFRTMDDAFVTASASRRLQGLFTGVKFADRPVDARAVGIGKVGHFGFFRSRNKALWPIVTNWIERDGA